jgi:hypothetical protein
VKRVCVLVLALLLGLAVPTIASAQFGPTNVPAPLTAPDTPQDAHPFEQDTGLSTLQLVLMFGGAIAIVSGIAWFIMRDAHRAAPASQRGGAPASSAASATGSPKAKSARERERERARKRNKAKAARNQRRRNRPR